MYVASIAGVRRLNRKPHALARASRLHEAKDAASNSFKSAEISRVRIDVSELGDGGERPDAGSNPDAGVNPVRLQPIENAERQRRRARRAREQLTYQVSAVAATALFLGLATFATYYRFFYHTGATGVFPWFDFWSTLAMIVGGVVAMELYARWAHRVLWHEFEPGWRIHASHHAPREGPFEANDIFAVMNAAPAILLTAYGFFTPTHAGGLCFGFGMGITVFGVLYMFVHDGLVHKRFPVGPIAELPMLKRVAIAHRLHHSERYGGVPFGMFLGPQELEAVGAGAELDRLVEEMRLTKKSSESRQ